MIVRNFGPGLAPAVTIVDGLVYVAYGVQPDALIVVALTPAGVETARLTIAEGFFDSFPRFAGPWLVYKRNWDWRPVAVNLRSGQSWAYRGQADGNFGVVANAELRLVAYQWTGAYAIWFGSLLDGTDVPTDLRGAPDGLAAIVGRWSVTLRKDTRESVPGMLYPVRAGDLTVGERPDAGVAVQLAGEPLRVALAGQDTPTPACATEGDLYAIVTGGPQGVRLLLGSRDALRALPLAAPMDREPGPVVNVPAAPPIPPPDPGAPPRVPPATHPVHPHHPGPPAPLPASGRSHTKGLTMEIDGKVVVLRGAGGRLVSPDAPNTGTWGSLKRGWRGNRWTDDGGAAQMHAKKLPNGRYTFTSKEHNGLAGADGGQYSPALDQQIYFKPDGDPAAGDLEQWRVYDGNENGAIEAQIEQTTDGQHPAGAGKPFFAYPLAVEIVS